MMRGEMISISSGSARTALPGLLVGMVGIDWSRPNGGGEIGSGLMYGSGDRAIGDTTLRLPVERKPCSSASAPLLLFFGFCKTLRELSGLCFLEFLPGRLSR